MATREEQVAGAADWPHVEDGSVRLRGQVANLSYFWRWLILGAIVAFVLATRFWTLGAKPFHHDESMFASYAFHLRMTGDYDYNPVLHGPFLEDISALIFRLFGDSNTTARLWSALAGTLLLLAVWRLRNPLGNRVAGLAVAFLAVSPTLLFYSRFDRNDVPFTLAAMIFVLFVVRFVQYGRPRCWFLALLAVAWMICIKETYVIFLYAAASFVVGVGLVEGALGRPSSLRARIAELARQHHGFWLGFMVTTAVGVAAGVFLTALLYSTGFRHPEHVAGPLEALRYWKSQHAEQRIFGEFHYYASILIVYEFLFLALFVWGIARTLRRAGWLGGWIAWGWAIWSAVLLAVLWPYTLSPEFARLTHMTRGWHLWLAVEVFALGAAACTVLVIERRWLEGVFVWWTVVSFLAYSYAGEKVPWLAVHIVFPMTVTAAIFAQELLSRTGWKPVSDHRLSVHNQSAAGQAGGLGTGRQPVLLWRGLGFAFLVVGFVATVGVSLRLCFVNNANPAERHVYTHTTADYTAMVADIQDIVTRTHSGPIGDFPLILQGDSLWPGQWYFRRWQAMRPGPIVPNAPIIVVDEYLDPLHRDVHALSRYPWLLQTHVVRRVPFREWWHQEMLLPTVARLSDIWMALVPKQYRNAPVSDAYGRPIGLIGDREGLPNMTIADEITASQHAWRDVYDYLVYRRDFDPYRSPYPTRNYMSVLLCVEKNLYKQWTHLGGRHQPARSRFVRRARGGTAEKATNNTSALEREALTARVYP